MDFLIDDACLYLMAARRLSKDFLRSSPIEIAMVLHALDADDVRRFDDTSKVKTEVIELIQVGQLKEVERMADIWRESRI